MEGQAAPMFSLGLLIDKTLLGNGVMLTAHNIKNLQKALITQLNIEGRIASKLSVPNYLAHCLGHSSSLCTYAEKLAYENYVLAGSLLRKKHGLATFVQMHLP